MSAHNDYVRLPATDDLSETTSRARLAWATILTIAAISASLALSCVTPFAALAVALAGTVGLRQSLRVVAIVWLANQFVGLCFSIFRSRRLRFSGESSSESRLL
jgi:phosphate/sulfate permease